MNKNTTMVLSAVLIIVAAIGGFFGGMQYQKSKAPAFGGRFGQFQNRFGQNGQSGRPVRGQILSIDPTGMTIKMNNGTSEIVIVSNSTAFVKSAAATKNDVATGDTVMVIGTPNSDGSITAQDVQINPTMVRGGQPSPTQ